jgi:hypothetical protein
MERRDWGLLFLLAAVAAFLAVFVFRRNLGAELMLMGSFGLAGIPPTPPADAAGWFALLRQSPLLGLTLLEVFDLVEYALVGLIFLALCVALWEVNRSALLVATAAGLAGIVVYFASNQSFAMLALSRQHAAASGAAQEAIYLAAGEALLRLHEGTGIYMTRLLAPLAGLIMSLVMLRSAAFSRATAVTGIVANVLLLTFFPVAALTPALVALPFALSAPFRIVWYFLIASCCSA